MVLHGARCYRVSHSVTADVSPFLCVWATPGLWCAVASLEIQLLIAAFENKQERISAILTHRMHTSNNARKPSGFTAFFQSLFMSFIKTWVREDRIMYGLGTRADSAIGSLSSYSICSQSTEVSPPHDRLSQCCQKDTDLLLSENYSEDWKVEYLRKRMASHRMLFWL